MATSRHGRRPLGRALGGALAAGLLLAASSLGCASIPAQKVNVPIAQTPGPLSAPAPPADYQLAPGDELEIRFFYNPALNVASPVRPDGRISLELIGDVQAAGLTPAALRETLAARYADVLRRPEIAVIVKQFGAQRVYVGGEVRTPGVISTPVPLTAMQAIVAAGGARDSGELKTVVILRNQGTPTPAFMAVNLAEGAFGGATSNDVVLRPLDIVFVPKTPIARVNQFVSQYVNQLIPIPLQLGLGYAWADVLIENVVR